MRLARIALAAGGFIMPLVVFAATAKYTFNDVDIDGVIVEITAGVKDTAHNDFTRCDYFSDNYLEWLGYYGEPVAVSGEAAAHDFCVGHFVDRTTG
mgnify:CR=1 FL=1